MEVFEKGKRRLVVDDYQLENLVPRIINVIGSVHAVHGQGSSITVHVDDESGWSIAHQTIVAIILSHVGQYVDHAHPVPVRIR